MRRQDRLAKNKEDVKNAHLRMSSNRAYLSQLEVDKVKDHKQSQRAKELEMEKALDAKRKAKCNQILSEMEAEQSRQNTFAVKEPIRKHNLQNKLVESNTYYVESVIRNLSEDNALSTFLPNLAA